MAGINDILTRTVPREKAIAGNVVASTVVEAVADLRSIVTLISSHSVVVSLNPSPDLTDPFPNS